jgi:hypothetical protein
MLFFHWIAAHFSAPPISTIKSLLLSIACYQNLPHYKSTLKMATAVLTPSIWCDCHLRYKYIHWPPAGKTYEGDMNNNYFSLFPININMLHFDTWYTHARMHTEWVPHVLAVTTFLDFISQNLEKPPFTFRCHCLNLYASFKFAQK